MCSRGTNFDCKQRRGENPEVIKSTGFFPSRTERLEIKKWIRNLILQLNFSIYQAIIATAKCSRLARCFNDLNNGFEHNFHSSIKFIASQLTFYWFSRMRANIIHLRCLKGKFSAETNEQFQWRILMWSFKHNPKTTEFCWSSCQLPKPLEVIVP